MGSAWKKHKYIAIENGRYIYPGDEKKGKKLAQDDYAYLKARMKKLKRRQRRFESEIDDNALGDEEKTKRAYKAGDKLDLTLDRMERVRARLKKNRQAYKKTFGNKIKDDIEPKSPHKKSPIKNTAQAEKRQEKLQKMVQQLETQRKEQKKNLKNSQKTASQYYRQSANSKKDKNETGYQVNGIIGKKYESAGIRYARRLNATDRKIKELNDRIKRIGNKWLTDKKARNQVVGRIRK